MGITLAHCNSIYWFRALSAITRDPSYSFTGTESSVLQQLEIEFYIVLVEDIVVEDVVVLVAGRSSCLRSQ